MITYRAPTRIDIAGGTVDIWPLYLMIEKPATLNAAIDLYASVELEPIDSDKINIYSKDLNKHLEYKNLDSVPRDSDLGLITNLIHAKKGLRGGFKLTSHCRAPKGSGLGGSSALSAAVNSVLNGYISKKQSLDDAISFIQDVETSILEFPTGVQDYYPALLGEILFLEYRKGSDHRCEQIDIEKDFLERHIILCYTGESRLSSDTNWNVYKTFLENDTQVREALKNINEATHQAYEALKTSELRALGKAVNKEWNNRKLLAGDIESEYLKKLMDLAMEKGATAVNVCGAGGGGCFFILTPEGKRTKIKEALANTEAQILEFSIASEPQ